MTKSLILRKIPEDVYRILLIEQHNEKINKHRGQFGIEQTIYKIVREFERCKKQEQQIKK